MTDESMTDVSYCECKFRLPEQGGLYCAYCGKIILTQDSKDEAELLMNDDDIYADTVTVDRALLVKLARLVLQCLLEQPRPLTTAEKSVALVECECILREHGDG